MIRSRYITAALAVFLLNASAAMAAADEPKPAKCYLITDHGVVGDGQTLNTKAIQSAIDRCASDGSGVVVVPKGTFRNAQ